MEYDKSYEVSIQSHLSGEHQMLAGHIKNFRFPLILHPSEEVNCLDNMMQIQNLIWLSVGEEIGVPGQCCKLTKSF